MEFNCGREGVESLSAYSGDVERPIDFGLDNLFGNFQTLLPFIRWGYSTLYEVVRKGVRPLSGHALYGICIKISGLLTRLERF